MSDLAVMELVGSEIEAVLVCSILRDAGIQCMHRVTNVGSGAMDGLMTGGPREIIIHPEDLRRAREVVAEHRDGPRPSTGRTAAAPPLIEHAVAASSVEAPDERVAVGVS